MNAKLLDRLSNLSTRDLAKFSADLATRLEERFTLPDGHPDAAQHTLAVRQAIEMATAKVEGKAVDFSGHTAAFLASEAAASAGNPQAADAALAAGMAAVIAYSIDHPQFSNDGNLATWAQKSQGTEEL